MKQSTTLLKIWHFFLTKIILSIAAIILLVILIEWMRNSLLDKTALANSTKDIIIAALEAGISLMAYITIFKNYEKRRISELSISSFPKNAGAGFIIGLLLQSLFIGVIAVGGRYSIMHINPVSSLISPFAFALMAGFVAEIILVGILFRLLEEEVGTAFALMIFIVLFAAMHINAKGATWISVLATAFSAGFMIPASYIYSRSLWFPIFLHFSWDLAEPGIFGGINSSSSLTQSLLTSKISGASWITGGQMGPQDSIQSALLCLATGIIFLLLANKKHHFLQPTWRSNAAINQV